VGCGLCQEACPEKAIGYKNEVTLDEILAGYQRKLQEITLFTCQLCQSKYPFREGESFCPSCKRRKSSSLSDQDLGNLSQKRGEAGNVRDRFA
jgi:ferredoxin